MSGKLAYLECGLRRCAAPNCSLVTMAGIPPSTRTSPKLYTPTYFSFVRSVEVVVYVQLDPRWVLHWAFSQSMTSLRVAPEPAIENAPLTIAASASLTAYLPSRPMS